ncbi:hypothetical protein GQ607_000654 [Colletotrichum asianum]|uniref:Uncharacterized protein n=1 Tax=Colletotrichum asianum TaxID=702518 RepID=A0A8H3WQY9_9PEZI|nr:hypothetical protein GQ607_000654 [Colletotrichum asianum]
MASLPRPFANSGGIYSSLGDNPEDGSFELHDSQQMASTTSEAPTSQPPTGFGEPCRKRMFYKTDIAMAAIALACFALSILVVANSYVSWYLGVGNHQLIVIGVLLSIMSQCLASVTPLLFLLLEAHFGKSTLQNFDGILRNKPTASKLSFAWRMVLVAMLALPIGLSVAYKTFTGGKSSINIYSTDYIPNATYYGLFRPPGIISSTGLSSNVNATESFRNVTQRAVGGTEPPLPTFPHPYGYNLLLLNESSAASLDTPYPDYILAIQQLLAPGESWTITAPVIGTVATLNRSAAEDHRAFEEEFVSVCKGNDKWSHRMENMFNDWSISLTVQWAMSDQSLQYIGIAPGLAGCTDRAPYEHLYNIYRQQCLGTWSVSRGSFQLLSGSCNDTILPWAKQQVIQRSFLALPAWYMGFLIEMLNTFSGNPHGSTNWRGNQSSWMMPYMSVSVSTMLWSRIAQVYSVRARALFDSDEFNKSLPAIEINNITKATLSYGEAAIFYQVDETDQTVIYTRPTLRKSSWLYLVLGIQPVLLLIILGMIALLHTAPLDRGFGLISILSGIERRSLDLLRGASLSGKLKEPVRLIIRAMAPVQGDGESSIKYRIDPSSARKSDTRLSPDVLYH